MLRSVHEPWGAIISNGLVHQVLAQDKDLFSEIAVSAVLKLRGSTNLDQIQIIKRNGGTLRDSYLDPDGFLLDKRIGVGCPKVRLSLVTQHPLRLNIWHGVCSSAWKIARF